VDAGDSVLDTNRVVRLTPGAARNVISSNALFGVEISDGGTSNNLVVGNYVGTDVTGTADLGNTSTGVRIDNGATFNTVGGTSAAARNVVSGNGGNGITLADAGTSHNLVQGNFVGTSTAGNAKIGNDLPGVAVAAGASDNTIGGTAAGAGNLISGNKQHGVMLRDAGTNNNVVQGNLIGTDATGMVGLSNGTNGDYGGVAIFSGASNNLIGGTTAGARNVISGNENAGFGISDPTTTGNRIQGNYIGTNITGTAAIPNGEPGGAVFGGATNTTIGGTAAGAGNLISGDDAGGVDIVNPKNRGNLLHLIHI
jgi:titin